MHRQKDYVTLSIVTFTWLQQYCSTLFILHEQTSKSFTKVQENFLDKLYHKVSLTEATSKLTPPKLASKKAIISTKNNQGHMLDRPPQTDCNKNMCFI